MKTDNSNEVKPKKSITPGFHNVDIPNVWKNNEVKSDDTLNPKFLITEYFRIFANFGFTAYKLKIIDLGIDKSISEKIVATKDIFNRLHEYDNLKEQNALLLDTLKKYVKDDNDLRPENGFYNRMRNGRYKNACKLISSIESK